MKRYRIDITQGNAEQEIDSHFLYIAEDSRQNAINWYFNLREQIQSLATTISNSKATISTLKEPSTFFSLLKKNGITYPQTQFEITDDSKKFLRKKVGGKGGEHISWAKEAKHDSAYFFQEFVSGDVFSVLFLANGTESKIIGFNQQLKSEDFDEFPFLYKGAIRLNKYLINHSKDIENIINSVTSESGLRGLCGLDYIVRDNGEIVLLEVNPRPPATFELHEEEQSLFDAHLACFDGKLIDIKTDDVKNMSYNGYAVLYAKEKLIIKDKLAWPDWVKDKPPTETKIQATFPVCTVHATDSSVDKVKGLLFNRLAQIETMLYC